MTAVSDDFNRADSSNLGASWTEVTGDWEIVSNRVQVNTDGGATGYYARYETDVGSSDMFSQAVTSSSQSDAGSNTGLAVRMRSAANTSYQMTTRHGGDTIGVWRIVAGAETQQSWQTGAQAISVTINSGDTIRVEAVGSLIRGKVSGALIGLCVDTTITDGQRAGLNGYNNVGTDVVEMDDFAGGALADDGGLVAPYIVGVSAQVTGTGTTLTPTIPPVVAAGDLVVVQTTSRDAAQTMSNPGSEGWSAGENPSQTGLEDRQFAKVWGLGGQTDDTTPTFSIGSGTAGWGATVTVFRNPAHSTAPWTSVASAIVASGSAANAASATATAPSVNHDGSNRTVVRLFSSADDNALGAPSTGALAYGAAAYDQTTGNDYSQAMSLREDITVTTNTGTSTVTETVNGNDVNNGITLVLAIPTANNVSATGLATLSLAADAAATPDVPAAGLADLTLTASASATVEHPVAAVAALGLVASAAATTEVQASGLAALDVAATATATVDHPASGLASLTLDAVAAATVERSASGLAALALEASATPNVDHPASGLAALVVEATALAAPSTPQQVLARADLAVAATATANVEHPVFGTSVLVLAAAGSAGVEHPAAGLAALVLSATAAASPPAGADPNPTIGDLTEPGPTALTDRRSRLAESTYPSLADPAVPRLREPR